MSNKFESVISKEKFDKIFKQAVISDSATLSLIINQNGIAEIPERCLEEELSESIFKDSFFENTIETSESERLLKWSCDDEFKHGIAEIKMDINNEILKGKIYECNSGKTCNLKNIAKNVLSLRDSIKKEDLDIAINKLKTINNVYLAVSSQEILDVIKELFGGVKECQEFATKEFLGMSSFEYNSPICKIHVYCEKALGVGTYLFYEINR